MSSWKKAAKSQKIHRERHQPESRKHLGLLEKKKDYVARAKDYHKKQSTLKLLRKRALNKNPDEFYFHMIKSKIQNGIHREKCMDEEFTDEQRKLMETQDLKYIAYKKNLETKKVEKLHSNLHLIDAANKVKNKHIFFVENYDIKKFDLADKINTHPVLIGRRTNRPKLDSLQKMKLPDFSEITLEKVEKQKHQAYKELSKRIDRENELAVVQQTLEIKGALKEKNVTRPIKVIPGSKHSAPIYKWKYERKK